MLRLGWRVRWKAAEATRRRARETGKRRLVGLVEWMRVQMV
jgi:hypothetical protein